MARLTTQFLRITVGALFIFSGIVKLNDPSGFAIKLDEYFHVFSDDAAAEQSDIVVLLKDDMKEVADTKLPLYSFDNTRDLFIESFLSKNGITANELAFEQTVIASIDGEQILEYKAICQDTLSIRTFGLEVSIDNSPIYQQSFNSQSLLKKPQKAKLELKKYIHQNSFLVDFFSHLTKYSLWFSLIFCALEVILGFALIIGWRVQLVAWLMFLLVVFFTFLTAYSYYAGYCPNRFAFIGFSVLLLFSIFVFIKKSSALFYKLLVLLLCLVATFIALCAFTDLCFACEFNKLKMKVTDCGCFGDFLKLKPWESFYKDIALTLFIAIILINAAVIKPWFSKKFGNRLMAILSLLTIGFGLFCYFYLPLWDFLPYKKGNDVKQVIEYLPDGERAQDSMLITFSLRKGDDSVRVPSSNMVSYMNQGYEFVPNSRKDKIIIEGYKSPIHDFTFTRNSDERDITNAILNGTDFMLIWICSDITETSLKDFNTIAPIQKWAKAEAVKFITSTYTDPNLASKLLKEKGLDEEVYRCDQKTLLTMARYNSTLYLFKGPMVINKWSALSLPSTKKLTKLCKE